MKKQNLTLLENLIRPTDEKIFRSACDKLILRPEHAKGVGTLGEKSIHAVLKYYYIPDERFHEIPIDRFVADACKEGEIFEIQSRGFHLLKDKLDCFLKDHEVTVVYPIAGLKWLRFVDPETGEIKSPRKSPKKGHPYDALNELISIRKYLSYPHLHVILCILETEEYTILDGYGKDRKKHATRADKVPVNIIKEIEIDSPKDYLNFLPENLPDEFTTKDIAEAVHRPLYEAQALCTILSGMDLITKTGTRNRYYLYTGKKDK